MKDKYVKAIKDELKGLIKATVPIKSYEASISVVAYKRVLGIVEKYERRDARAARKDVGDALTQLGESD